MKPRILVSMPLEAVPNYAAALKLVGAEPVAGETACDGLILPGGGDLAPCFYGQTPQGSNAPDLTRDARELNLFRRYLSEGKPILGICRGAQVIAVALGGTLYQQIANHDQIRGTDRLHETRTAGLLLRLYGPEAIVNSAHHQSIDRLPTDCRILQIATDGIIEGFCHNTLPVLGVQWHPERLCGQFSRPDAVDGLPLFQAFLRLCGCRT